MGRLGFSELLVILFALAIPLFAVGVGFLVGYFVGKGIGLKQGRREASSFEQARPPGS
jgi:hypothetical protein